MPLPWNPGLRHGMHKTKTYAAWGNMLNRCRNAKHPCYRYYGGRGIYVDSSWLRFENFLADMGVCPDGLTLERLDNNGPYSKANCKWATWEEQHSNTRRSKVLDYDGKSMSIPEWARYLKLPVNTLYKRLYNLGWSVDEALSTPYLKKAYSDAMKGLNKK